MAKKKRKHPRGKRRGAFRSSLEGDVSSQLLNFKWSDFIVEFEPEYLHYTVSRKYLPDFRITFRNGHIRYIEAKGWFRSSDRTKILAVIRDNPSIDLRLLFEKDNRLNKGSNTYYSDWCKKHGIKYAIGTVPKSWVTTQHEQRRKSTRHRTS